MEAKNPSQYYGEGAAHVKSIGMSAVYPGIVKEYGGWGRNRTGVDGFAGRCITTLPPSLGCAQSQNENPEVGRNLIRGPSGCTFGAGNETRTRDIHVGNVMLYQLSYSRNNHSSVNPPWRYRTPFQSVAEL